MRAPSSPPLTGLAGWLSLRRITAVAVVSLGLLLVPVVAGQAAIYHVAPHGSDGGAGSERSPFATITRAVAGARKGDTVLVRPGRYPETVQLTHRSSGVTIRGQGERLPVIAGEGKRLYGFISNNRALTDLTIERLSVTGQTRAGLSLLGSRITVRDVEVRNVGAPDQLLAWGIHMLYGEGHQIVDNVVRDVGPGGESYGIMLTGIKSSRVERNMISVVRKEGVRDFLGLDNIIRSNQIGLCWTGIAPNASTGTLVENNYLYDNVQGINPKHSSGPEVLNYWKLDSGRWTTLRNNTIFRSRGSSVTIAINPEIADLIRINDNLLSGAGGAFVADFPEARGKRIEVDDNHYSTRGGRPVWLYHTGFNFSRNGVATLEELRRNLGWEQRGVMDGSNARSSGATPQATELRLRRPGRAAAGAEGLPPLTAGWRPYPLTVVDAVGGLDDPRWAKPAATADARHHTYWRAAADGTAAVTLDLGAVKPMQYLVFDVLAHGSRRAARHLRIEAAQADRQFSTVLDVINPDALHSSHNLRLPPGTSGRFVRVRFLAPFCSSADQRSECPEDILVNDISVGRFETASPPDLRIGRTARWTSSGDLRLQLRCLAPESGRCIGVLTVRDPRSRRKLASRSFHLTEGRRARAVTVRLSRAVRRTLRRSSVEVGIRSKIDGRTVRRTSRVRLARLR
jgi:hypothetical protein